MKLIFPFALLCAGLAAAAPVTHDNVRIDLPDGWSRQEETRYAAFASPDGKAQVFVLTRLGDEDADDLLDAFIEQAEAGETSIERGKPQELADDVYRQTTISRTKDDTTAHRIYLAAGGDANGVLLIAQTNEADFPDHERDLNAILASAVVTKPADQAALQAPDSLPGDGGLDGIYAGVRRRGFLNFDAGLTWDNAERLDLLYFDPLGEVYRGGPARFDIGIFAACTAADAWRCGRYRFENGALSLRWADGATERRAFATVGSNSLTLDGETFVPVPPAAPPASGAYVYRDAFNTGFWQAAKTPPSIRLLDDGRFELRGFSGFHATRLGDGITASGRMKRDGRTLTLVYATGATEVVGMAEFPAFGGSALMLGGRVFMRAADSPGTLR